VIRSECASRDNRFCAFGEGCKGRFDTGALIRNEQGVRPMHSVIVVTKPSAHDTAKQEVFRFADEMGALTFQFPDLYVFALFTTEDGRYVYSRGSGWGFCSADRQLAHTNALRAVR